MKTEKKHNLILIEKDDIERKNIIKSLNKYNYNTTEFEFAKQAFEFVIKHHKKYSLIIINYLVHDINGIEFLSKIKKLKSNVPIIFLLNKDDENIAAKLLITGAVDFVIKDKNKKYYKILSLKIDKIINNEFKLNKQKNIFDKVNESNAKYKRIFYETPTAIFIADAENGILTDCNKAACKLTGYSKIELIGMHQKNLHLPEEHKKKFSSTFHSHITDKEGQFLNTKILTKKGIVKDVSIRANTFEINGRKYIEGIFHEIGFFKKMYAKLNKLADENEEKLKQSDNKYQSLVELSPFGIMIHNGKNIIYCNKAAVKIFKAKNKKKLIGLDIMKLVHPDYQVLIKKRINTLINSNKPAKIIQEKFINFNNEIIDVEVTASNIQINDEKMIQVIFQDITEKNIIKNNIKQLENEKELVLNNLFEMVIYQDNHMKVRWLNEAAHQVVNKKAKKIIGNKCYEIWHQRNKPCEICPIISAKKTKKSQQAEVTTPDGKVWLIKGKPVFNDKKEIIGMIEFITEITKQKISEKKLHELTQKMLLHVERTPLGIIEWDKNFKVTNWNPAAERIFGYKKEEVLNKHPNDLIIPEEEKEHVDKIFINLLKKKGGLDSINNNITKNKKLILCHWRNTPLIDKNNNSIGVASMVEDITEKKRAEENLKKSREELRNLAKYYQNIREQEKKQIAWELHEDIAQILSLVKYNIDFIEYELKNQETKNNIEPALEKAVDSKNTILIAIDKLRKTTMALRPTLLDNLGIKEALEWYQQFFEENYGIYCELTIIPHKIYIDKILSVEIYRIFQEALINVAKHAKATKVKAALKKEKNSITLFIEDNGIGITENQINNSKSMGILSLRERLHPWNGDVKIKGVKNKGTSIIIKIPINE
ncbi:MAG: PAS domain S-box protein [Spirochaetia bacterium]|nr:PAS domain S-box protein [Spirochaetia bacterium]